MRTYRDLLTGTIKDIANGAHQANDAQRQLWQQQQPAPLILPPATNPMSGIPTMYTQQAPTNSLAPMAMYQAYKSGQMPAGSTGQPAAGAK